MRRSKAFVDTNILVYAIDMGDPRKHDLARALLARLGPQAVVSTQVLQEFYSVATRKLGFDPVKIRGRIAAYPAEAVVASNQQFLVRAVDLSVTVGYSIWDSLILQAAIESGCDILYTADMHRDQVVNGVRIDNPFVTG